MDKRYWSYVNNYRDYRPNSNVAGVSNSHKDFDNYIDSNDDDDNNNNKKYNNNKPRLSDKVSDLYSEGVRFESRSGQGFS